MALRAFAAVNNIVVGRSKSTRNLRDAGVTWYNLSEVIESEEREWVALTQSAALEAVAARSGENSMALEGKGVTYEHDLAEQNRTLKAYVYRCAAQKKSFQFLPEPK